MNQMCSSVDIFGLICDLATSGADLWRNRYPDLVSRQSIWRFLSRNTSETRVAPQLGIPYILHTCDLGDIAGQKGHITCLRTKTGTGNTAQPGGKLATYASWDPCTTVPNSSPPDYEFYDYTNNRGEIGNDFGNPASQAAVAQYQQELGAWGPPSTGLIASELDAPLIGTGNDGRPLTEARDESRQIYFDAISGPGKCTVS